MESLVKKSRREIKKVKNDLKRQSYELKYYKNKYEAEVKKRYNDERFIEEIKSALHVVQPLKPYKYARTPKKHKEQELVLLFSDCQIGEKIQKKETGYRDYDIEEFGKRLKSLYTSVLNITDRHRKDCDINTLNIFTLGDIVEGRAIFRGQSSRVTNDVVEQMFRGQEMIANFIRNLAKHYKKVKVPCIPGNHGRVGMKDEELAWVNWDYVIYRNLEQILKRVKNVEFDVDKKWWKIVSVQGWRFYMEHGDRIKKYWSIPWYGLERGDNRVLKMMRALGKDYDYFIIGHHHVPFEWDANRGERICNGTFSSGNPYAMRDLKVVARPTQKLFGVHKDVGITFRYNIRMDFPKKY